MGLLDAKTAGKKPRPSSSSAIITPPVTEPRGELQADRVAVEVEAKTFRARMGLVEWKDGHPFLHYCEECGAEAFFGYGVNLQKEKLGRWFCRHHRPGMENSS